MTSDVQANLSRTQRGSARTALPSSDRAAALSRPAEGARRVRSEALPEPTVVFIIGTVRSGSTLLARLLDGLPGVAAIGEVRNTWRALALDEVCSCGQAASRCEVWASVSRTVTTAAAGSFLSEHSDRAATLRSVELLGRLCRRRTADRQALVAQWHELYLEFASATGAQIIVDTSKTPASLVVALATGLPVVVIHLVRDPRAVAFSEVRRGDVRGRRGYVRSVLGWCLTHALADHHPSIPAHHHLRYEDLASAPRATLEALSAAAGLPADWRLDEVVPGRPSHPAIAQAHDLAGNRMRKQTQIRIRADEEWRQALSGLAAWLIAISTTPVRRRFGYRART